MECNKEEAIRAKEIALKKMENQDFAGALKVAFKSQRLYPGLENINQVICVCEVHCSAENKKLGNERDWYDILKVEQSADETLIKKQYRKLALLLHPDKNKFSGAESAFMLIGEAQKVLLDKDKRFIYDARYRRFFQNTAPNPPEEEHKNAKNAKPPSGKNNMTKTGSSDAKKKPQQQADPVDPSKTETFWTVCPFCCIRYRYSNTALNKNLKCQSCKRPFVAYDMCAKPTSPGSKVKQTDTSAQTGGFNQGMGSSTSKPGSHANSVQSPSGSNAYQAACAQGVSSKGGSSGTSNGKVQGSPGQQKSRGDAFAKSAPSTRAGKSNTTNELNTGAKSRASSGGSNHAEAKDAKKGKKKAAVEEADVTVGKREKKRQASVEKKGDTVSKKKKNQTTSGKTGDTVTEREKQASAEKSGDSVAKRAKKEVKDALEKSGRRSQSNMCTGPEDKIAEKGVGASAGSKPSSQSKKRASGPEVGDAEETPNSSKVSKREKQESAEKPGDNVAKRVKKEVKDALEKSGRRSQSKPFTGLEDKIVEKGGGASAGSKPSSQSKKRFSDPEVGDADEIFNSLKRRKGNAEVGSTDFKKPPDFPDENVKSGKDKANENHGVKESNFQRSCKVDNSDPNLNASPKKQMQNVVPDNDFKDFEQLRKESNFKANQIWAVYDTVDSMPRFYAVIKKVFSRGSKLQITWLEPDPDEKDARCWADEGLPFSCGTFVPGLSETTEDHLMFSQSMCWEKVTGRKGCIKIFPRKGETWALFREWHIDWLSNPHSSRKFECEFAEILSDYDGIVGIRAAVLGKLKGFTSLYCREVGDEIHIPPGEYLRFSHRVPSYRMTGEEGEGVPKGSFELDPASIPLENLTGKEIPLPEEMNLEKETGRSELQGVNLGVAVKEKESGIGTDQTDTNAKLQSDSNDIEHFTTEASSLEPCELPEPEFFNFDATRDLDRFQVGQVWALYSDTEGLPKCYGQIKRVCLDSPIKLRIAWLEAYSRSNDLILWRNKENPICCGKFKIRNRKLQGYYNSSSFSHELQAEKFKLNVFEIYPKIGQIWALYKNWNVDMAPSDLEKCDYDVVEILEQSIKGTPTKVLVLEKVSGYSSVFKFKMNGSSLSTKEIPSNELLRFSHQIPAHVLTEEKEGSLRGFKELDPSALPKLRKHEAAMKET